MYGAVGKHLREIGIVVVRLVRVFIDLLLQCDAYLSPARGVEERAFSVLELALAQADSLDGSKRVVYVDSTVVSY